MRLTEKRKELDDVGFTRISAEDLGLDARRLSRELVRFIGSCDFPCLPEASSFRNLGEYITHVHKVECGNELTSMLYQLIPSVPAIYRFASSERLIECLKALGLGAPTMGTVPLVRIDRPGDRYFSTPWHQDSWFSFSSPTSLTLWMPLGEMLPELGNLEVIPSSHRQGIVSFRKNTESNEPYRPRFDIDEQKAVKANLKFGEVLVFRQVLLHRSGDNTSDQCRVSLQLRFNDMQGQPKPYSTFVAKSSSHVTEMQAKFVS